MRNLLLIIVMAIVGTATAGAQNFLQHLQQRQQGQGVVTVNENKKIDSLVNNILPPTPVKKPEHQTQKDKKGTDGKTKDDSTKNETHKPDSSNAERERHRYENRRHTPETEESSTVNKRKKVMLNGHRANGYRVQVYRGGGTRDAKQKAQALGNQLKTKFPGQPIYVHFFSPNWTVRMGNFRSQEEAVRVLRQVKKAGFNSATLVRGPITVSR